MPEAEIKIDHEPQWREEAAKLRDQKTRLASRLERLKVSTPWEVKGT